MSHLCKFEPCVPKQYWAARVLYALAAKAYRHCHAVCSFWGKYLKLTSLDLCESEYSMLPACCSGMTQLKSYDLSQACFATSSTCIWQLSNSGDRQLLATRL
ncbi:TPA: hypothetical protein ACH3X3_012048 [Trebouxia sp. C0006]